MRITTMIKRNLFKTAVITMSVLTLSLGMTACGKKNNTVNDTTVTQENVTTADKNNTKKSSKVVFDYTDADGVTTKLEGNATVNDNGEAVIEVIDNNGNKAVFTGKASTDNGKLSVSDIKVKDASTLVKTDGTEVKVSEDAKIEDAAESTEATKADVAAKEDTIVADGGNTDNGNVSGAGNEAAPDNTPDYSEPAPASQPEVPDYNEPDNSDNNDTGNTDSGSSNTGNSFYDDYMNGSHMAGDEDLIDKDSDPSKPCPYPLNTPIEGEYTGVDGDGIYGTYPVYIVYTLCSEDATGGMAERIVRDTYYEGKRKVNGKRVSAYVSLPIGEYDCGLVRASYVTRY
jgi:hypothetical protein